jgi:hypothetical protein
MSKYLELLENLKSLEAERARIQAEGDALFDCWIAESKPGGTARTNKAHCQLRSRKPQFDGKKSKYLKVGEIGRYEAAIARGKQLKQLERQIETLSRCLDKIETVILAAGSDFR